MIKIGFTGTRRGMTAKQVSEVIHFLASRKTDERDEFHHGNCIGSDEEANIHARLLGYWSVAHPPTDNVLESKKLSCAYREPKDFLVRNVDIVMDTDILIVTPFEMEEVLRSGTWATYRAARRLNKPIKLILPQ